MRLSVPWLYPDEHGNWPDREVVFTVEFLGNDPAAVISEEVRER